MKPFALRLAWEAATPVLLLLLPEAVSGQDVQQGSRLIAVRAAVEPYTKHKKKVEMMVGPTKSASVLLESPNSQLLLSASQKQPKSGSQQRHYSGP
jgi:hypothetical protein